MARKSVPTAEAEAAAPIAEPTETETALQDAIAEEEENLSEEDVEWQRRERLFLGEEAPAPKPEPKAEEPSTEPSADAWQPPSREEWERTRERAAIVDGFDQRLQQNAPAELAAWYQSLNEQQRQAYLQQIGVSAAPPQAYPFDEYDEDTMTPFESFVKGNREFVQRGHERVTSLEQSAQAQQQAMLEGYYQIAVQQRMLQALSEIAGFELPQPDVNAVAAAMRTGKNVFEAVDEVYGAAMEAALSAHQTRNKPVPQTPGSRGAAPTRSSTKGVRSFADRLALMIAAGEDQNL